MARTTISATSLPGSYAAAFAAVTLTAADVANKNQCALANGDILLAFNSGASPHTVTLTSIADEYGRLGTISADSVAAGAMECFGPFKEPGWQQADGMLYFEADHAEIKFAVLRQP